MTARDSQGLEDRCGGGWARRALLAALILYLAPAVLVVVLIGVLGLFCCATLRLAGVEPGRPGAAGPRRHGPAALVRAPHLRTASRSRSPSR